MREKIENKIKLDELDRKQMAYFTKSFKDRKKLIQKWFDLDKEDQESIDAITSTIQTEQESGLVEECNIKQDEDRPESENTESGGSDNSS
jgi:hypothetical protein